MSALGQKQCPLLIASGYEAISRSSVFIYNIDQSCCEWRKSPPLISGGYMFNRRALIAAITLGVAIVAPAAYAQDKSIVVASTTSTQDSGLFEYLLPIFKQKTGITVRVLAQGTGQALDTARRGDADVVFVHAKEAEEKFVAEGFGVKRNSVMYNDFVIIGPKSDPAGIKGAGTRCLRCKLSKPRVHPSSRAATDPARILRKSIFGMPPASTSRRRQGHGTNRSGRAWGPRSTWQRPVGLICCLTAARGSHLSTKPTSSSQCKAISGCSTSTASYW